LSDAIETVRDHFKTFNIWELDIPAQLKAKGMNAPDNCFCWSQAMQRIYLTTIAGRHKSLFESWTFKILE